MCQLFKYLLPHRLRTGIEHIVNVSMINHLLYSRRISFELRQPQMKDFHIKISFQKNLPINQYEIRKKSLQKTRTSSG